ncbi:MAG: hypothetical protein A2133_10920 [Actinobacteria bacterium RBG_16_64_13]|nr:MAG: hypothetical protein A2133_10920 [Actinobacteria bacterium RBG_16_64_13]
MDRRLHRDSDFRLRRTAVPGALVALLALLVLAIVGLTACGGGGAGADPQTVLAGASVNMKTIKGFHFVYEVHKPAGAEPGSGLEIGRITGDINTDGNMQATVDVTQGGLPLSLEFIAVGDTHYIRDPLSQKWTSIPAAKSPVGTLNLSTGTIRILDRITETSYEGQESKGGVKCHHISGKVAAEEVKAIAGMVDTTNLFPTDIWVGVGDGLVYEVDIEGPATPNEAEGIWRSIVLSELDKSVDIRAPQ